MDTPKKIADLLLAGVLLLVFTAGVAESLPQGCSQPGDRCLPIRYCPVHFNRAKTNEHVFKMDYKNQLRGLICEPEKRSDNTLHVCCPKENIRCSWKDSPAACTRLESCPSFRNKNERDLLLSNETTLCYLHNQRKFYCCSEPLCGIHPGLCDADEDTPVWARSPSAFPKCEGQGSLVPRPLCNNSGTIPGETKTCCKPSHTSTLMPHPKASQLAHMQCGYQGDGNKIQQGNETQPGEFFPWMVALRYRLDPKSVCGGALVHPRYILTAAHCIKNRNIDKVIVHLGVHLLLDSDTCLVTDDCPRHVQEISIEKKIVHNKHDIALLKLSRPADIVPGQVVPICLPIYNSLLMHLPTSLTITGWGKTTDTRVASRVLRKANTQVLQNQTGCDIEYTFCAGGVHYSNHCSGDSGGPYQARDMYNESVRYVQYGVISGGSKYCKNPNRPSRGVLVGYFIQWILNNMDLP